MDGNGPGIGTREGAVDADDQPLLDLLDALVNDRGPTGAAEALGVNYRTVSRCQQSRRVTRRMRQVLVEFRDRSGDGDDGQGIDPGDGAGEDAVAILRDRAAALEDENRELREMVEAQEEELEALRRQILEQGERERQPDEDDAAGGGQGHVNLQGL